MKYRFLVYGLLGWVMEVVWTGVLSAARGDPRLTAGTYLWMFPIYGLAVFLEPLHDLIRPWPWFARGCYWVLVIWSLEFITGGVIRLLAGFSPWYYTGSLAMAGLIRLDMAPLWFGAGLIFEQLHDNMNKYLRI